MHALELTDLTKIYSNNFSALKGINLHVAQGDFFALLGPNGAGKSTTIGIITTLIRATSGTVKIFGYDLATQPALAKACVGLVPQEANFNIFETVQNILLYQAGFYGVSRRIARARSAHYLSALGLWDKRDQPVVNLSGGMKRRLLIARALIHQPRLLILDEPTAGVDIELRRHLWDFLRELNAAGTTIILTTHYLEEAENLCKHIGIMDRGHLIEHASMKALLNKLQTETLVFNLTAPITLSKTLAEALAPFTARALDDTAIEIEIAQGQSINDLFSLLSARNFTVRSMRNKVNRLEELFLKLTNSTSV